MNSSKQPIGYRLTSAREQLSLSIDDVVSILKIKAKVIIALEQDAYPNQMIDIFTKGQLVSYCKLLKIEPQIILNTLEAKGYDFQADNPPVEPSKRKFNPLLKKLVIGMGITFAIIAILPTHQEETTTFTQPLIKDYNYEY